MRHSNRYSRLLKLSAVGLAVAGLAAPAAMAYPVDPDPTGQPAWKNRVVFVYAAARPHRVKVTTRTTQRPCPHSKVGCLKAP